MCMFIYSRMHQNKQQYSKNIMVNLHHIFEAANVAEYVFDTKIDMAVMKLIASVLNDHLYTIHTTLYEPFSLLV